jgi:hypothetical protein
MSDIIGGRIRSFVERIKHIDTELQELNKGEGFDVKNPQGNYQAEETACATLTDEEHGGTPSAMARVFCDVRDRQSMLSLIAAA